MKKIISIICSAVIAMASLMFSGTGVTAETEHHDNVLVAEIVAKETGDINKSIEIREQLSG